MILSEHLKMKRFVLLDAANSFHPNLPFTLEEGEWAVLGFELKRRGATYNWYQKPTDSWTISNYRSCAQLSTSVVLSKTLYIVFLGLHLTASNLIRLWKLIGRNG